MKFKTYTESSRTVRYLVQNDVGVEAARVYFDTVFNEYKLQVTAADDTGDWYIKASRGHVKIYKSMTSVYKDLKELVEPDDISVTLLFEE